MVKGVGRSGRRAGVSLDSFFSNFNKVTVYRITNNFAWLKLRRKSFKLISENASVGEGKKSTFSSSAPHKAIQTFQPTRSQNCLLEISCGAVQCDFHLMPAKLVRPRALNSWQTRANVAAVAAPEIRMPRRKIISGRNDNAIIFSENETQRKSSECWLEALDSSS